MEAIVLTLIRQYQALAWSRELESDLEPILSATHSPTHPEKRILLGLLHDQIVLSEKTFDEGLNQVLSFTRSKGISSAKKH
jgi:hypothetical protein